MQWKNSTPDQNSWYGRDKLEEMGFSKLVNDIDAKEAARLGLVTRPLTEAVVQKHLEDLGLEAAFGTHSQMRGLSGWPPLPTQHPSFILGILVHAAGCTLPGR